MEFRVLGPLEVREDGRVLPLGGGKEAALLTLLLLRGGETISIDRLIDALWAERPPASAAKSIHVYVSHLRRLLGDGRLVTRGRGYALELRDDELDLARFEKLVTEAKDLRTRGQLRKAATALSTALSLWHGRPLAGLEHEQFVSTEVERLEKLRLETIEEQIDLRLELGEASAFVSELEPLVREHPLRERLRGQLMLALYRSGRQAEALEAYRQGRQELAAGLGLEPGRPLQNLEQAILRQDPALDPLPRPAPARQFGPRLERSRASTMLVLGGAVLLLAALAAAAVVLSEGGSAHILRVLPNSVGVIDPKTNKVVGQIAVGIRPGALAVGKGSVWVGNQEDKTLSRIDVPTRRVERTIPLDATPTGVAEGEGSVWVAEGAVGALARISPEFNAVTARLENLAGAVRVSGGPSGSVALGDAAVWVAYGNSVVARINPTTNRVVATGYAGFSSSAIAYGEGAVWITNRVANTVSRFSTSTNRKIADIAVGRAPSGVAVGGGAVWVTDTEDNAVSRVDPGSGSSTSIPVGLAPAGIAFGQGAIWVANSKAGTVSRIDPATSRVVATIKVGVSPAGIAVGGGLVWVTVAAS